MGQLGHRILDEPSSAGRSLVVADERPLRLRTARCEQRDLVTALDEFVGEESDHQLDAAVALGWNRDPAGRDLSDLQVELTEQALNPKVQKRIDRLSGFWGEKGKLPL